MNTAQACERFRDARDFARTIAGENYTRRVGHYQDAVLRCAAQRHEPIPTATAWMLAQTADPLVQLFLLAAAVDILDPLERR